MDAKPNGVHLMGSIRLPTEADDPVVNPPTASDIFKAMTDALPGRLRRIPDGETGTRHNFINDQDKVFLPSPWVMADRELASQNITVSSSDHDKEIKLGQTGYDTAAVESYRSFVELRQQSVIPKGVRLQVCLPTPIAVIPRFVRREYQAKLEPMYEALLLEAVERLQNTIPHKDLAIQWDCPLEFAFLEGATMGGMVQPWFDVSYDSLVDRIERLVAKVKPETQLGFHLCYGDLFHQHFVQPTDTSKMVELANMISARVSHQINFVHMPVPQDRKDDAYFEPLKGLKLHSETETIMGLVHTNDLEGTKKRIEAAQRVVKDFQVSTECGWGRTPVADVQSILQILKEVSDPV